MTSYKLTYFNGRGGGEICRLTFSAAGLDFEDERLSGDDWKKRKPGKFIFEPRHVISNNVAF